MHLPVYTILIALIAAAVPAFGAGAPIPEAEQPALALKILDAYTGKTVAATPLKLHVVYFTPSDRDPEPRYQERLQGVMENIQAFYREQMERDGFGAETFDLARDASGKMIIHMVKGAEPEASFKRSGGLQDQREDEQARTTILRESRAVLQADGINLDSETVIIFCNLAHWDPVARTFSHHSPYVGDWTQTNGHCFAVDSVILNADDLDKKEPILHDHEWGDESLGKFNTVFIGGIAHELGHAFTLPHCGERFDERSRGRSLMGIGNHTYHDELRGEGPGAFLTMASALKLAGRPLFNHMEVDMSLRPKLLKDELHFSTNVFQADLIGRPNALRMEGMVRGAPPVYGVIAYFDSSLDGGYSAPTATAVPDADGHFAIEISDLKPTRKGELRVQYCHANGAISERDMSFDVAPEDVPVLGHSEIETALEPLVRCVLNDDKPGARAALDKLEKSAAPELAMEIGRKLTATLDGEPRLTPADVAETATELALGDAKPQSASVGWFKPAANRIPKNDEVPSPLLSCGKFYATGLFAHAPSTYVFDLGGRWKSLRGEAGLHTAQQSYGSVDFIIKGDGKELFHSSTIRGASKAKYNVDVTHVRTLELVVDDGGDGNGNDWALWLDPTLTR